MPWAIEPPAWKVKVSWLSAAPTIFSKPAKLIALTVPEPAPVTCQLVSVTLPCSVSLPEPAIR